MKQDKTWVIVTNSETARLFEFFGRVKPIVPLKDHVWHAPEINEDADMPGVTHSSVGQSQRKLAPHTGPDKQADAFAHLIADKLARAAQSGAFERLIIIAAPRMIGLLRAQLEPSVQAMVDAEIDKDLTHMPVEKVEHALKDAMFG